MRLCWLVILLITIPFLPEISASTPVVDGHNHEGLSANGGLIDTSKLEDLRLRGIEVVMVPLPVDRSKTSDLPARIAAETAWLRQDSLNGSAYSLVDDPNDLLSGLPDDRMQLLFSIEWFQNIFSGDPASVRLYRDLGVRVIGLTEGDRDGIFESSDHHARLSPFGKRVITAMNEAGVLIDITHLSHEQKLEVIAQSRAPVVASHSLVQAVVPNDFSLPDEVVTALADNDGSVWVSFQKEDLLGDAGDDQAVDRLIDHIAVLVERLGHDRVGVGTDLQAGGKYVPATLNQHDAFTRIRRRMQERGFEVETIDGILGENVLRLLAESN